MLTNPTQLKLLKKVFGRSKYRAKRTTVRGINFPSKAEAARYLQLLAMEHQGKILNLQLQPKYEFASGIKYRADFKYWIDGKQVVEDVKGKQTADNKNKLKLMRHEFKIEVQLVRMNSREVNQILEMESVTSTALPKKNPPPC